MLYFEFKCSVLCDKKCMIHYDGILRKNTEITIRKYKAEEHSGKNPIELALLGKKKFFSTL